MLILVGLIYNNPNGFGYYSFSPSIGYYFKNNLAIGLQLGYSSSTNNYIVTSYYYSGNTESIEIGNSKLTNQVLTLAPLLRYTIPIVKKIGFNFNFTLPFSYTKNFSNVYYEITGITTADTNVPATCSTYSIGVNISPGIQWFVKNNIALIASFGSLSYNHYKTIAPVDGPYPACITNANDLKLSLTTGISLGATFYFGGKNSKIIPYSK